MIERELVIGWLIMENLVGKNKVLNKSYCLKIMILLSFNKILISDLIYALSCLELIDENENKNNNMQSYNPMLFIKKNILTNLKRCIDLNLIYVKEHYLNISEEGKKYISDLIDLKDEDILNYIKKIRIIKEKNYHELYVKIIKSEE